TYVVNDYRYYGLPQPPRGHHCRRSDAGDFLLVAMATGIIADIILSRWALSCGSGHGRSLQSPAATAASAGADAIAIGQRVPGVDHHAVPRRHPLQHLYPAVPRQPRGHAAQARAVAIDDEHRMAVAIAEDRTGRQADGV